MSNIELTWLLDIEDEDEGEQNLLAAYYREVANGPMKDYRRILQGGSKQGQNYFMHVLDGIGIFHKLRAAGIVGISDLEEQLLFAAFTIHDMNKIPPYGGRDVKLSYKDIVTSKNIRTELVRIDFGNFFFEWEDFLDDIWLLAHLHQHDAAPLFDLDRRNHAYKMDYERLLELGKLMYAVDNLDLSHTLSESNFKENFLANVNALSERRWCWVKHRLGENRGLLSNIIHNNMVRYLQERHTHNNQSLIADMLYYPDGVAYLLPERETFTWSDRDNRELARRIVQSIEIKKGSNFERFVQPKPMGIKVANAVIESQVPYTDIMYAIRRRVESKRYVEKKVKELNQNVLADLAKVSKDAKTSVENLTYGIQSNSQILIPLEQERLQCGELVLAYRNLLEDHLRAVLKKANKSDAWAHLYKLLELPGEQYAIYNRIYISRRGYFIARDYVGTLDSLFDRLVADIADLTDEQIEIPVKNDDFQDYLSTNLEISGVANVLDFKAYLQRYVTNQHKQCCTCSSPLASVKLMESDMPSSSGVQMFSNRLPGGGGEPKRNVCPICRTQFILEKLTCVSYDRKGKQKTRKGEKKNREGYTSFYLHLYPYAFFTAPYLNALYSTLKNVCHEDNQCFFLNTRQYFERWERGFKHVLKSEIEKQAQQIIGVDDRKFGGHSTKVNGVNVPIFSEAVSNTPTLLLNAPGENHIQQFLFTLTHALMIGDFFGCRVSVSRTPVPLLTNDYMAEKALTFFVDGVPLALRWLLPTHEYRSIESYRGREQDGGFVYVQHMEHWSNEHLDEQGYAAYENISIRLATLYEITRKLNLGYDEDEEVLLEIANALADDPFSIYHVVDLAIEKKLKEEIGKRRQGKETQPGKPISSEHLALSLSKRVAPLLAEIVKE